jgi:hypothetical protein
VQRRRQKQCANEHAPWKEKSIDLHTPPVFIHC